MSKRFTDTSKWLKPWFRKLPPKMKLFWQYILDNCDNSGVIDIDFELASFCIGEEITNDEAMKHISKQIHTFNKTKWFVKDFIDFQFGELSEACKPHKHVIDLMKKHSLWKGYSKGMYSNKDKDKDKEKDKDKDKEDARLVIDHLNKKTDKHFKYVDNNIDIINARMAEGYSVENIKTMIDIKVSQWKDTESDKFLRPETLFGKTKFQGYINEKKIQKKDTREDIYRRSGVSHE